MAQSWSECYEAPQMRVWSGRQEQTVCRIYQNVRCLDLSQSESWDTLIKLAPRVILLGFSSDEGVLRNQGRVGSKAGPEKLREKLAKLPIHFADKPFTLVDAGNIVCEGDLEASQAALGLLIEKILALNLNIMPIILGGGHETAFGHYLGLDPFKIEKLGIINFDAHLDMRPLGPAPQVSTSGTPFLQIAQLRRKNKLPFNYTCIGLQKTGNTKDLFDTMSAWNVKSLMAQAYCADPDSVSKLVTHNIKKSESIYVSICLDVFAEAVAPGVSAPSPHGLLPWQVILPLQQLAQSGKVISLDIVELAPNLDDHEKTARLGATLIAEFIYNLK